MLSFGNRVTFASSLAIALALLTGCASTPSATPTTPAATSPSASAPTPTPTTGAAGAEPAEWIIDFEGVGPLTIGGSSAAELPETAPAYTVDASGTCPNPATSILQSASNPTIWVQASGEGADDIALIAVGGDLPENGRADGSPRTTEGVGIGSPLAETEAAYPAGTVENDPQGDLMRFVVNGEGPTGEPRYLVFDFYDDVVQTILIQTSSDVVNDFCA
ncbi:hypothetical protein QL996_01700 [Planococcus sp. APC 4015]|nr:hypothetical protein [Planococcus sp. APC 4015]